MDNFRHEISGLEAVYVLADEFLVATFAQQV